MTRPTGVVATIGPSLLAEGTIRDVVTAGASGFRIPLARQASRGVEIAETIRAEAARVGADVEVYLDVPGVRRFLKVDRPYSVGEELSVRMDGGYEDQPPCLIGPTVVDYLTGARELYTGDGEARLHLLSIASGRACLRVDAGELGAGVHGVTVPGRVGPLDDFDQSLRQVVADLPWAQVVLSFVESADQADRQAEALGRDKGTVWAKVETAQGVAQVGAIADRVAGVLVGRGDLLLDAGPLAFADLEVTAIDAVLERRRPLMVGTQLWTSSAAMALPHRSELSWMWQLMRKGVDQVMLSDETTVGSDPAGTVATLVRLAEEAARSRRRRSDPRALPPGHEGSG